MLWIKFCILFLITNCVRIWVQKDCLLLSSGRTSTLFHLGVVVPWFLFFRDRKHNNKSIHPVCSKSNRTEYALEGTHKDHGLISSFGTHPKQKQIRKPHPVIEIISENTIKVWIMQIQERHLFSQYGWTTVLQTNLFYWGFCNMYCFVLKPGKIWDKDPSRAIFNFPMHSFSLSWRNIQHV